VQSQLERAQQAQAPRFQQAQGQQGLANNQSVSVNGQPLNVPLNSSSQLNAQSLFYGIAEEAKDSHAVAEQVQINTSAQKKVAKQAENEKAQRQTTEVTVTGAAAPGKSIPPHVANPGVRYSLRRKTGNGKFQQVDPGDLKAGDTLELEIIPNDSGVLSVSGRATNGGWRQIVSRRVERLKTVITRLKSGEKELLVSFKRQPVALTGAALFDEKSRANVTQSTAEPATYVVGDPASQQVDFTITLIYK